MYIYSCYTIFEILKFPHTALHDDATTDGWVWIAQTNIKRAIAKFNRKQANARTISNATARAIANACIVPIRTGKRLEIGW